MIGYRTIGRDRADGLRGGLWEKILGSGGNAHARSLGTIVVSCLVVRRVAVVSVILEGERAAWWHFDLCLAVSHTHGSRYAVLAFAPTNMGPSARRHVCHLILCLLWAIWSKDVLTCDPLSLIAQCGKGLKS